MNFENTTKDEMIAMLKERGVDYKVDGEQLRVMDLTLLPGAARAYFNQQTGEWTGEAQEIPSADATAAAKEAGGDELAETEAQLAAATGEATQGGTVLPPEKARERAAGDTSLPPANAGMGDTEEQIATATTGHDTDKKSSSKHKKGAAKK